MRTGPVNPAAPLVAPTGRPNWLLDANNNAIYSTTLLQWYFNVTSPPVSGPQEVWGYDSTLEYYEEHGNSYNSDGDEGG